MKLTKRQREILERMAAGWYVSNSGGRDRYRLWDELAADWPIDVHTNTAISLLNRGFIAPESSSNSLRYRITDAGRAALKGEGE